MVLAITLLGCVVALGVHYDGTADEQYPYPNATDIKTTPNDNVGTQVFVFGTVETVDSTANTARIRVDTSYEPFTADVTSFTTQRQVQSGGIVQVYGTFQSGYRIDADTVRVVNPSGSSAMYKYTVSVVAVGILLVLFFRYWRVDIRTLGVTGR
jgi:hypothetical protein